MKYSVVCPLAEKDVEAYLRGLPWLKKYLDVKQFVVIGNEKVEEKLKKYDNNEIVYVNENQFVSFEQVKRYIAKKTNNDSLCLRRTGWYLQQFLKFSYSLICEDEYYLLWDADTMPICTHIMEINNHPVFDMKTEHHEPYFKTFERLFPEYKNRTNMSYISEHMLIKTSIMRELISDLSKCNIEGESWHEKIINAIDIIDLPESGFADYETYGLYCLNKYPNLYIEREWDSLRPASSFFEFDKMRERDYAWIQKDYSAVSFEASRKVKKYMNIICRNAIVQKFCSCKKVLKKMHQFTI